MGEVRTVDSGVQETQSVTAPRVSAPSDPHVDVDYMQPTSVIMPRPFSPGRRIAILAVCYHLVSVVVETIYSRGKFGDAYFLVKFAGWILLSWGAMHVRA